MRALVAGWFSFEQMGATAGDLVARDLACAWLREVGFGVDIAHAPPFAGGVDWRTTDPENYSHVVFVCGPFGNGEPVVGFLERFEGRRLVGLNLSMLDALDAWNPFDLLLERDSSETARPDLTFLGETRPVPIVGVVLVHKQTEYRKRGALHERANAAIDRLLASREVARVPIDTRLDVDNTSGLRSPAEIEALLGRMDAIVTTRLHGLVLGVKNGVPVVALDPVAGGAKVLRQAQTIGWPFAFEAGRVTDEELAGALDRCLAPGARALARECAERAAREVEKVRKTFLAELAVRV